MEGNDKYNILLLCPTFLQDECSFVSLRDVERAMIVFHFFMEKRDLFKNYVAGKADDEVGHKNN